MKATIIGCGEAFDERLPNTSVLVEAAGKTILCDCGYSVPPQVWSRVADPNTVDIIYISHPHADHYFGMPALLGRMWEEQREKPLAIVSQPDVLDQIKDISEYGYRGLAARFQFPIEWRTAKQGEPVEIGGIEFDFAESMHSVTNLAVRMRAGGKVFCYSGDGMFTDRSRALFAGADLLVHEAYFFDQSPVHADIGSLLEMAESNGVRQLALVHVQRGLRREPGRILEAIVARQSVNMPDPGAEYQI
jgi:ribonuclease BN (tRNA processing enzyme)